MDKKTLSSLEYYSDFLILETLNQSKRDYCCLIDEHDSMFKEYGSNTKNDTLLETKRKKCEVIASDIFLMHHLINDMKFVIEPDFDPKLMTPIIDIKIWLSKFYIANLSTRLNIESLIELIKGIESEKIDDINEWVNLLPQAFEIYKKRINEYPDTEEIEEFEFSRLVYKFVFEKVSPLNLSHPKSITQIKHIAPRISNVCKTIALQMPENS